MKSLITSVLAGLLVLLVYQPAGAQQPRRLGSLSKARPGVLAVMDRVGCHPSWLSQVIAESPGITPANLRQLPVGQPVIARGNTCRGIAPASVRSRSMALLANDSTASTVKTLGTEVASLRASLVTTAKERDSAQAAVIIADSTNATLSNKLREALALANSRWPIVNSIPIGIASVFVGALLCFLFLRNRDQGKNMATLPDEQVPIKVEDQEFVFRRTGIIENPVGSGQLKGLYGCPCCPEKRMTGHFVRHLKESCPGFSHVVVKDPGNVLGAAVQRT